MTTGCSGFTNDDCSADWGEQGVPICKGRDGEDVGTHRHYVQGGTLC